MSKTTLKDHRELGRELELFFFDEISPGSAFWLPKGMIIFKELEKLIRSVIDNRGYQETSTPIIVKSELFKKSGHWEYFKNNMFNFKVEREEYSIKPMNCPESTVIFASFDGFQIDSVAAPKGPPILVVICLPSYDFIST